MIEPVPVQDMQRVADDPGSPVLAGPELRTIHLFMDQKRDELKYSSVKGRIPSRTIRVRKAFYQAIDIEAIRAKVMRSMSVPGGAADHAAAFRPRRRIQALPYDPVRPKKLLAEAGYPDGFEIDHALPQRSLRQRRADLSRRHLDARARSASRRSSRRCRRPCSSAAPGLAGGYDTSFGMLGWTPSGFDSLNIFQNLTGCRDDKGIGTPFNFGGYCNPESRRADPEDFRRDRS